MADEFDPYHKWLGIPAKDRPITHYRLLGLSPLEDDADVIQDAADRSMAHVRTYQTGKHSEQSQKILNELSTAKICLLNPQKKAAYDAALKAAAETTLSAKEATTLDLAPVPEAKLAPAKAAPAKPRPAVTVVKASEEDVPTSPRPSAKPNGNMPLLLAAGGAACLVVLLCGVAAMYLFSSDAKPPVASNTPPINVTPVPPGANPAPPPDPPFVFSKPNPTPPNPTPPNPNPNPNPDPRPPVTTPTTTKAVVAAAEAQPKSEVPESYLSRNPGPLQTLMHPNSVGAVAITPDGRRAITSGADPFIRVWNLETGAMMHQMPGHSAMTWAVGISADGKRGVSGSFDRTIRVWDLEKGTLVRVLQGHENWVVKLALSPDGKRVLSPSYDRTVRLWDAESGEVLQTLKGHKNSAVCAAFVPGTKLAVSGGGEPHNNNSPDRDNALKVWNLETGELVRELKGHTLAVDSVAVTPDGKYALSCSWDRTVRMWDLSDGSEVRKFEGHTAPVKGVSISRDQTWLASCSIDGSVRLWDLEKGALLTSFPHQGAETVAFAGDRRIVLTGGMDRAARLWRVPDDPQPSPLVATNQPPIGPRPPIGPNFDPPRTIDPRPTQPPAIDPRPPVEPPVIAPPRVDPPVVVAKKSAVPDTATLGAARKTFKEVFADELKGKKSQDKLALARELLKRANGSQDDPAGRYVFLEEARDAANDAGDASLSWQAIEAMDRWYEIDMVAMKSNALKDAARLTRTPPKTVAQMYRTLVDQAAERDDFDSIAALVTSGIAQARKVKDDDLVTALQNRGKEIRDMRAEYIKLKTARETLATSPDDAEAALLVGKHLCLVKNQWDEGLPLLAKSTDEVWKKLAEQEQTKPRDPDPQVDLGDLWWTESEKDKSGMKSGMQRRAAFWYTKARSGLGGLTRARIEKRLSEAPKPIMTGSNDRPPRERDPREPIPLNPEVATNDPPDRREINRRFVDRGDIVEDSQTGLLWQKDGDEFGRMNHPQAVKLAEGVRLGRMPGWRLPTKDELAGIFPATDAPFRDSHYNPNQFAPNTPGEWVNYWTAEGSGEDDRATLYHWYGRGGPNGVLGSKNFAFVRLVHDPVKQQR